jgi:hypothetical protein
MDTTLIYLVCVNFIPVFGVLFFGWNAATVVHGYWYETVIIGFFFLLKILFLKNTQNIINNYQRPISLLTIIMKIFLIIFFAIHFGMFVFVHKMFLTFLMPDTQVQPAGILSMIISLFISHGLSFLQNFIGQKEYDRKVNIGQLMLSPYQRIIIMQCTIIFGAFLAMLTQLNQSLFIVFILAKIFFDIKAHQTEHQHTNIEATV